MHRLSACVVVLLWCAAPILAAVHAGTEVHRYCPEHDAVEEVSEAAVGTSATPGTSVARDADDLAPGHEDCSFARFCRFGQVLSQLILEASGTAEADRVAAPALESPAPAVAVIVIAPKTSPPV